MTAPLFLSLSLLSAKKTALVVDRNIYEDEEINVEERDNVKIMIDEDSANRCAICLENEIDNDLICQTCNKAIACRSCLLKLSKVEENYALKCPLCRGLNKDLLEEKKIIKKQFCCNKACLYRSCYVGTLAFSFLGSVSVVIYTIVRFLEIL